MKIQQLSMAAILAAFVLPVFAEAVPQGSARDSRILTAEYHPDQVYRIRSQIGRAVMVQLEADERLSGDAALGMGDADAWKVAVRGNNIIFKPQAASPQTNMLLSTNKRSYAFSLTMGAGKANQAATYILRFTYPDSINRQQTLAAEKQAQAMSVLQQAGSGADGRNTDYWAYGHRALAPTAAWDNGRFTYLQFNNGKGLPVVYKIMPDGTETLLNSHLEGDTVVIHETAKKFVLRLGKSVLAIENRGYDNVGQFNRTGTDDNRAVRITK